MPSPGEHTKTFQLSRYFAFASFVTIITAALVLGWLYREVAVADMVYQGQRHNIVLAQTVLNVMAPQIHAFTVAAEPTVMKGITTDQNQLQLMTFSDSIINLARKTPIVKIKIFSTRGKTVYSTDQVEIGHVMSNDYPGITVAHTGQVASALEYHDFFTSIRGNLKDRWTLSSYLPVRDPDNGGIEGVFEIYSDVTELYERIARSRMNFALGVAIALGCVYLILFTLVRRADLIIRGQAREREQHLEEIERINKDLDQYSQDLARTRDRAVEASSAKSQFLANMSHELRTPLNAIIGYSEMLAEDMQEQDETQVVDDLKKIQNAGRHLLTVINDILDLSKIEAGSIELYLENFDIRAMVEEVTTTIRPIAEGRSNELIVKCPANIGEMHSDLTRVRQILFNLLGNASKFTNKGEVRLEVSRKKHDRREWIVFSVVDTGIGLTQEQIENKIFQPFRQADASTTRSHGGTGLGLTITKKFCEMLGGHIDVRSTLGKGSTFALTLPAATTREDQHDAADVADSDDAPMDPHKQRFSTDYTKEERRSKISRILVIDDDPAVRELYQRFLRREGFEVKVAKNGKDGLREATVWRPDLIALDVMLPEMNGWEVLQEMKKTPHLSHIPVVMISIVSERDVGLSLGAADYMTKPIDWQRFSDILRKWLRTH